MAVARLPLQKLAKQCFDFAVGRDFGLGASKAQWKVGVRVADLRAKLTVNGAFAGVATTTGGITSPFAGNFSSRQESKFLGVGPRLGVEGETPLAGNWTFDWQGGVAVLFGDRKLARTIAATLTVPAVVTVTATQSSSSHAAGYLTPMGKPAYRIGSLRTLS